MNWEQRTQEIKPENLPFYSSWPEYSFGEIVFSEVMCPGVYYLRTEQQEYYAVQSGSKAISKEAKAYGAVVPDCPGILLFDHLIPKSGKEIIEYEVKRYQRICEGSPVADFTLHNSAIFGMELYPQYFGEFPVPFSTPLGYTCRHWRIDNGIYWIETDQCKACLAVSFPYCDEFSSAANELAIQTKDDRREGIDNTLGFLFFPQEASCIPIFELMGIRNWDKIINKAALMNAIWWHFPEYAAAYNKNEQAGVHDLLGMMQTSLGQTSVELHGSLEHMIAMTPNAGVDFLRFQ